MIKGYKIRIYPNKEQEEVFWKHINACRFIWNWMLNRQIELKEKREKRISKFGMMNLLTPLKKEEEYEWLNDVSNTSLQNVCKDLEERLVLFFEKKSNYPGFKSKKKKRNDIYPCRANRTYFMEDGTVHIEKAGFMKYTTDFKFECGRDGEKLLNTRISYKLGKWFLSFGIEYENQVCETTEFAMGIDLGIKELAVVAFGDEKYVFHNINKSHEVRSIKRRMKHLQRIISRKYEANKNGRYFVKTNNIRKFELKVAKLYHRLHNIRMNYIHQITHFLVSKRPRTVVMETLNIRAMLKNRHLSRGLLEQCLGTFIKYMKYKCANCGIDFIQADRFFPSSKTCSDCGTINSNLKLSDRTYVCESCGLSIDRDYNAAINLMRYAG